MSNQEPYSYDLALTDSEGSSSSIDAGPSQTRLSRRSAGHDHDVLDDEQETEDLLLGRGAAGNERIEEVGLRSVGADHKGVFGRLRKVGAQRRSKRKGRRKDEEDSKELVHEMEEGGHKSPSLSSESLPELDDEKLGTGMGRSSSYRRRRCFKFTIILFFVALLFVAIAFGAYKASGRTRKKTPKSQLRSNGTSIFAPTTVYISLDGFRADFLQRGLTPTLNRFIKEGVSPQYMNPSFPSLTFPNHFTLVTGLYPESHGVVGNTFWAPEYEEQFFYTHPKHSMQPKWWNAEPLWVTAEDQQVPTAIHMWPGSEAHLGNVEPTFLDKYNGSEALQRKVDRILGLLDLPGVEDEKASMDRPRPQLIAAYVPNVDADGHLYGPNSTEIRSTITDVDTMLGQLFDGLEQRNLTNVVNVIVVSDHGMATTSIERLLQLEDLVDPEMIDMIDGWPHYGLRLKDHSKLIEVYESLSAKAKQQAGFDVHLRDKNMPKRYHFTNNDRIAPLWIMPQAGWAVVTKDEFDVVKASINGDVYHPKGLHGYDHEHPLMRAIFVARGPAFPHKPGSRLETFQNIEVYNIVCDSIGVEPLPNNGTLRLPLVPVGFHDDEKSDALQVLDEDPPGSAKVSPTVSKFVQSATDADVSLPTRPTIEDDASVDDQEEEKPHTASQFWAWVKSKYIGLQEWAKALLQKAKEKVKSKKPGD